MSAEGRSTNDLSEPVSSVAGCRWSAVFHRSRLSPYVFVVAADAEFEVVDVVRGLDLPEYESMGMYSSTHRAWPLLDGAVARLSNYGWPPLPDAVRVYGHEPMRLLCHLLGAKPPTRRLTGERAVRTSEHLLADLEKQRQGNRDELLKQARVGIAEDTRDVLEAVRSFFGDDALDLSHLDYEPVMRGRGAWGDAGFSRAEESKLARRGVSAREATELRELIRPDPARYYPAGQVEDILRGHAYGLDELRRWIDAGAQITEALALLASGRSFDDAEPYLRAGCQAGSINTYIKIGFTPEQYADYKALGIDCHDAARFAYTGIPPEEALRWRELGASGWEAWVILTSGGSLADAREIVATGPGDPLDLYDEAERRFRRFRFSELHEYPEIMHGG